MIQNWSMIVFLVILGVSVGALLTLSKWGKIGKYTGPRCKNCGAPADTGKDVCFDCYWSDSTKTRQQTDTADSQPRG